MNVIAINGSPRKNGNTAKLLRQALQGAESTGADTELVNLYDLAFKGCGSCFACKRKGHSVDGVCAMKDELADVLKRIRNCGCLLLGSPIYFGNVTGVMRSFLERLLFPNLSYNAGERSVFPGGRMASGFIYTMNVPAEQVPLVHYDAMIEQNRNLLGGIFRGESEIVLSCDTYQFSDYSKYEASKFDEARKAEVKERQFPLDCRKAYELGARLASA